MRSLNVVLLQRDSGVAQSLISALSNSCNTVRQVGSFGELRDSIAKHRAGIAILDMEAASITDVERLSREFPKACIVCTHRLADDAMWTAAINAGATDVCPPSDTRSILRAALTNTPSAHSAAA